MIRHSMLGILQVVVCCLVACAGGSGAEKGDEVKMPREASKADKKSDANARKAAEAKKVKKKKKVPSGFALIKAGSFTMGSAAAEAGRNDDEPAHPVTLTRDFIIQKTEVTQAQWRSIVGNAPSHFESCGDKCPVESINRFEAMHFVNKLSEKMGLEACYALEGCQGTPGGGCGAGEAQCEGDYTCKTVTFAGLDCEGFRLPTEAEWEYAARAGTTTMNHAGDMTLDGERNAPMADAIAWYGGNSGATYEGAEACGNWVERQIEAPTCGPQPVKGKKANPWGLHDIQGNVWEWVHDDYVDYPTAEVTDPIGVDKSLSYGVVRGGSWAGQARHIRASHRFGGSRSYRFHQVGFRPARTWPKHTSTK